MDSNENQRAVNELMHRGLKNFIAIKPKNFIYVHAMQNCFSDEAKNLGLDKINFNGDYCEEVAFKLCELEAKLKIEASNYITDNYIELMAQKFFVPIKILEIFGT